MSREREVQRDVAAWPWDAWGRMSSLAGSGAIREDGLIDHSTEDVDLFATMAHVEQVERSAERKAAELRLACYAVEEDMKGPSFTLLREQPGRAQS